MRTKIKGITHFKDHSGLKNRWTGLSREQLNAVEAEYIFAAQKRYLQAKVASSHLWFNVPFLLKVHTAMLGKVWKWAGTLRTAETNIGVKPYLIRTRLEELCREVVYWNSAPVELTFLEQASRLHHCLVSIHPFKDGNGRLTRLIADRYLKSCGCSYPLWPDKLSEEGLARDGYIDAIQKGDKGDYEPLLTLMLKLGAKEPSISEILGNTFYLKQLNGDRLFSLIKAMIRRGANPNDKPYKGLLPLQLATKNNHDRLIELLVYAGAIEH